MTTFKLPEPFEIFTEDEPNAIITGYTEAQLKQAVRDALEQAAQEAERMVMYPGGRQKAPAHDTPWHAARAIRKMIGEIK